MTTKLPFPLVTLVENVNQWGDIQCPCCNAWIICPHPDLDYLPGAFICRACRAPATLGREICDKANEILEELRRELKDKQANAK